HPLYQGVRCTAKLFIKHHRSPLHHLIHVYRIKLDRVETIYPPLHKTEITNKKILLIQNKSDDDSKLKVLSENSSIYILGRGVGEVTMLFENGEEKAIVREYLGKANFHTVFEAELAGASPAVHL
ncbi:hypothetical protein BU17DRAFT_10456, partial [Hysterangium stoloniferum]